MNNPFRVRPISRPRAALAFFLAAGLDAMQLALGPLGWTFADEIADVIGLAVFSVMLGFHPLLLPTFIIEIIPVVDMLPTWTACVGAVLILRGRAKAEDSGAVTPKESQPSSTRPSGQEGPIVDV
jgi:hypothetical protein